MGNAILTSHAGSLPRPDDLIELNRRRLDGEGVDEAEYAQELHDATIEVVERQKALGIDLPNDGEYGHIMGAKVDYGAWWSYIFTRLGGLGRMVWMDQVKAAPPKSTMATAALASSKALRRLRPCSGSA